MMHQIEREVVEHVRKATVLTEDMTVYKQCGYRPKFNGPVYAAIATLKIPKGTRVSMPTITDKSEFVKELLWHTYSRIEKLGAEAKLEHLNKDTFHYLNELNNLSGILRDPAHYRKCRAEKAKVISMYYINYVLEVVPINSAFSRRDSKFQYVVGKTVKAEAFKDDIDVCAPGIHFFLTEEEARSYVY